MVLVRGIAADVLLFYAIVTSVPFPPIIVRIHFGCVAVVVRIKGPIHTSTWLTLTHSEAIKGFQIDKMPDSQDGLGVISNPMHYGV